jgi:hypothetical protein
LSFQANTAYSSLLGANSLSGRPLNQTQTNRESQNNGYNWGNNILWRHRFGKIGRTISVGLTTSANDRTGESLLQSINQYFGRKTADSLQVTDQQTDTKSNGYTISSNVSFYGKYRKNGAVTVELHAYLHQKLLR